MNSEIETDQEVHSGIIEQISENPEQKDQETEINELKLKVADLETKFQALINQLAKTHQIDPKIGE